MSGLNTDSKMHNLHIAIELAAAWGRNIYKIPGFNPHVDVGYVPGLQSGLAHLQNPG